VCVGGRKIGDEMEHGNSAGTRGENSGICDLYSVAPAQNRLVLHKTLILHFT